MKRTATWLTIGALSAAMGVWSAPLYAADAPAGQVSPVNDPAAKARAVVDRAVEFLKSQQLPDGGWEQGAQPPGFSALVLRGIVADPRYDANTPFIKKGYDKLLAYQVESGGIYKDSLANYNTAVAISALAAAENPAFKDRIDKAVAYLKSLQWTDTIVGPDGETQITPDNPWYGGAGYGRHRRPDGSNTQMMLDALYDAGVPSSDPAFQAAVKFVTRMQNLSETNDQPWAGDDGGAIYTPANGGESMAGEYTGPDGKRLLRSYGSMTYAMLKSYVYAGLTKDDPRVKAAWNWIRRNWTLDENPGMAAGNPDAAQSGLFYYYLTLARALDVYDEPIIVDPQGREHDWRVELIDKLASLQQPDGSFVGDQRWMEDSPVLATAYCLIALDAAQKDLAEHPAR